MSQTSRWDRLLVPFVVLTSAWLCFAMPVFAQESYYWCYAQHPALSYFDHPPMVAWLIWLGTSMFGDGAVGIRIGTFACGMGTVAIGLALLRSMGGGVVARRVWLLANVAVPAVVAARFLTNPDPALCCFWMATIYTLWRARDGDLRWWLAAGLCAGCALLSKYTAAFLAVGGVLVLLLDPAMRRQLRRPGPYIGVMLATVTFLPVIYWNVANEFESFRFQTSGRWDHAQLTMHWLVRWLGGELLVLNPVVALALPFVGWWLLRRARARDRGALWLLAFGVPMLLFLLVNATFMQVKINWATPAVLPLLIGLALWLERSGAAERRPVLARRSMRFATVLALALLLSPAVELFPQRRGSSWSGWNEIAARAEHWEAFIDDPDGLEGNCFFFAGDYRDAAQLTRGLKSHVASVEPWEAVEPTMAQNVIGRTALQFDHWARPVDRVGQDAIFVVTRPEARESLVAEVRRRFERLECVERINVTRMGIEVLAADIYVCRHYNGPEI